MLSEGNPNATISFVSGIPSWEGKPFTDVCKSFLLDLVKRAGIAESEVRFDLVLGEIPPGRKEHSIAPDRLHYWISDCTARLAKTSVKLFVPMGNIALQALTGHKSIDKWQLSVIPATNVNNRKCLPLYHPEQIYSNYKDMPFLLFGFEKIKEEMHDPKIRVTPRVFHTAPSFSQALKFLGRAMFEDALSVDIETAHGQITCVGIALSSREAMCIPVLPQNWLTDEHHKLWEWINDVLKGPSKKIFQNYIYDCSYFSRYGITVHHLWHDTMLAQKFLYPELPMGLDTIARIYTREPYWKDEGKDWKKADGGVGDLNQFWIYNCKDTTVTFEAAIEQRKQLDARGLTEAFERLVMANAGPASEMCWRGLPVSMEERDLLKMAVEADLLGLRQQFEALSTPVMGKAISPQSPKQVKEFFKAKGYRLPIKKGKESSDQTALLKLQQKYPNDNSLRLLLELSEKNKLLSSYLKPQPYSDGRFRFSLNIHGTETGRWSCRKDAWDNGINAQTISGSLKNMFVAPEGWTWVECDLKQADSRFVAWDAPEPTLIDFYSRGVDIHRFVAGRPELFNKPTEEVTKDERQLGKTVGHASNYGMRGNRLSEICLLNMGLVLPAQRADSMLEGYHRVFPGIRMWQRRIEGEIKRTKRLCTPLGRERYFYDRIGDDLFRVAYAYRPQSTVTDIVNALMRFVSDQRDPVRLHFALQVHDSLVLLCQDSYLDQALAIIKAESEWNPKLALPGGILQIPIEIKVGKIWGKAKVVWG